MFSFSSFWVRRLYVERVIYCVVRVFLSADREFGVIFTEGGCRDFIFVLGL